MITGIPYIFGKLEFSINLTYKIELLHLFMIKAIKKGASVEEISEAINFSENEVQHEFNKMCESGYIETDYKTITDFSRKYLELTDFIECLNSSTNYAYMNLIDGSLKKNINKCEDETLNKESPAIKNKLKFTSCNDEAFSYCKANIDEFRNRQIDFLENIRKKIVWRCLVNDKDRYFLSDVVYESSFE